MNREADEQAHEKAMRSRWMAAAFAVVLAACAPSQTSETIPATTPSIEGVITRVSVSGEHLGTILVETNPQAQSGSPKASVRISRETRILRREGDTVRATGFPALVTGQRVSVWFTGPVAESYPVQAAGGVVVLESSGG